MSALQSLLVTACILAPILLVDGLIVVFGLRVERREEHEASERRHGVSETVMSTAGSPFMDPAGAGVEQTARLFPSTGSDSVDLGPTPAGATRLTPQQSSASAGLERRHGAGLPRSTAGSRGSDPAVAGTDVEQARLIAVASSLGPRHPSSPALAELTAWCPR